MVVVNDCSNSSYDEIITLFRDERIVFLCNQFNSGVNFSRNLALEKLEELNCDFITFLDDDDYFENKSIFEHVLNDSIKNNDVDWLIYEVKNVCMDSESTDYKEFDLDYINDYLYGSVLIGDKHHFIKSHLAKALLHK